MTDKMLADGKYLLLNETDEFKVSYKAKFSSIRKIMPNQRAMN